MQGTAWGVSCAFSFCKLVHCAHAFHRRLLLLFLLTHRSVFSFPPFPFPIFLSLKTRRSGSGTARELSPSSYLRLPRRQPTVRLSVGSPATPSGAPVDGGARTQAGQRWATRWLRSIAPPPTPSWEGRRRGEGSRLVSDAIIYLSRRTPWLIVLWPSVFGL